MPPSKLLTIDGQTKKITEWAKEAGITALVIRDRMDMGWTGRDLLKPTQRQVPHGQSETIEYFTYQSAKARCHNPKDPSYPRYGGRGIKMCDRWRFGEGRMSGFECFLEDMGKRPPDMRSIDRLNPNGDYAPQNCVWASWKEQARNKRTSQMIRWNGKTQCVTDWAAELGISQPLLHWRLKKGWSVMKALTTPARAWSRQK